MRRPVATVAALLVVLIAAPPPLAAQATHRVGQLISGRAIDAPGDRLQAAFVAGLGERGWTEGHNIALERRYAEGRHENFAGLANELVAQKVDVLVAWVTAAASAAQKATTTIPIVTVYIGDPVELGFADSLGRPGRNITGLTYVPAFEVYAKQVTLLKELAPGASSVGVLWNPGNPAHAMMVRQTEKGARALGLNFRAVPVRSPREIDAAFAELARERSAAALVVADGMFMVNRARLIQLAAEQRLPTMYGSREYVQSGGLVAYGPDQFEHARRAAHYVDRILRGARPADLPMEQPTRLELAVNVKTANALGMRIPQTVLVQADHIIE